MLDDEETGHNFIYSSDAKMKNSRSRKKFSNSLKNCSKMIQLLHFVSWYLLLAWNCSTMPWCFWIQKMLLKGIWLHTLKMPRDRNGDYRTLSAKCFITFVWQEHKRYKNKVILNNINQTYLQDCRQIVQTYFSFFATRMKKVVAKFFIVQQMFKL